MARIPTNDYPGKIASDPTNYPQGKARDVSTPGDGTGTPLKETWLNDLWGLLQGLLFSANITPSGATDTVQTSQYRDAVNLIAQTGRILLKNNISNPNTHLTAQAGSVWDSTNSYPMPNTADFTKRADAAWAVGSGNGGLPGTVTLPTDGWLHFFSIRKADGTIDFGWDDQLNASKLLTASGFTYYKRLGSTYFDGSQNIDKFYQIGDEFFYNAAKFPLPLTISPSATRVNIPAKTPPDVITKAYIFANITGSSTPTVDSGVVVSSNTIPGEFEVTKILGESSGLSVNLGNYAILTDTVPEFEYRYSGAAPTNMEIGTIGYKEYF